jgi:hypothetical protein
MDVNAAFGRNARRDVLKDKVAQHPELLEAEPDDEIKAACAQVGGRVLQCGGRLVLGAFRGRAVVEWPAVVTGYLAAPACQCLPSHSLPCPGPSWPRIPAKLQMRSTGKAAPKRLTTHQRQIVGRLLAAHGEDIHAMFHDRKLNPMQHSKGVLKALIESYHHWKEGSGVDFRVPHKRLW